MDRQGGHVGVSQDGGHGRELRLLAKEARVVFGEEGGYVVRLGGRVGEGKDGTLVGVGIGEARCLYHSEMFSPPAQFCGGKSSLVLYPFLWYLFMQSRFCASSTMMNFCRTVRMSVR